MITTVVILLFFSVLLGITVKVFLPISSNNEKAEGQSDYPKSGIRLRLSRAGYQGPKAALHYHMLQVSIGVVVALMFFFASDFSEKDYVLAILSLISGCALGTIIPSWYIDRIIRKRDEDILYHLPLMIEQLVIGVTSGLDVGPCIQRVVGIAEERGTHNSISLLLADALRMARSGRSLDQALNDIGSRSGNTELKHALITLAHVLKHGGEITRQLHELATAVKNKREIVIEQKIKKLELQATGPVALVFASFMSVLLAGIGLQVLKAFGN